MSETVKRIAIVGANLAGGIAASELRQAGFEGQITLIGEERWPPYERPPLSKELLWDNGQLPESFFLKPEGWYDENRIDLKLGVRAEKIDLAAGRVELSTGQSVAADRMLLTTGGRPRKLQIKGADAENVHYLRTREDAERIAEALMPNSRIVVIGMGVIGAEVAASARKRGCEVIAVEPEDAPMTRTLGRRFGGWLANVHRDHGVDARYRTSVTQLHLERARVCAVECSDGQRLACDAVCVGIGIVPAMELASDAGLETANGIVVDRHNRTSNPNVFSAGDVAEVPGFFGGRVRYETFQNAQLQGSSAARAMLGIDPEGSAPCWFWSDQYDYNIQVAGRIADDLPVVVRGSSDDDSFTAFFTRGDVIEGVLTVNRPQDMAAGRRLISARLKVDLDLLASESASLRSLLRPSAGAIDQRAAGGARRSHDTASFEKMGGMI